MIAILLLVSLLIDGFNCSLLPLVLNNNSLDVYTSKQHGRRLGAYAYYNGNTYALLALLDTSGPVTCQTEYMSLQSGYYLAPDVADIVYVIASYPWSAHVVVTASGIGYNTAQYGTPGGLYGTNLLSTSGNTFKPTTCSLHILQVTKAKSFLFPLIY